MAEPIITEGRRVETVDDIERAGDYCLTGEVGGGRGVWFLLPTHEGVDRIDPEDEHTIPGRYDRPTEGSGLHRVSEPPWTFRECDDGSIEIRASILCGKREDRPEGYWHGFLDEGHRWRQLV